MQRPDSYSSWQSAIASAEIEEIYQYNHWHNSPKEITDKYETFNTLGMGRFIFDGWANNPFGQDLI